MGNISLAIALVAGRKRVPSPATGNTALRTALGDLRNDVPLSVNTSFRFRVPGGAEMLMSGLRVMFYVAFYVALIKFVRVMAPRQAFDRRVLSARYVRAACRAGFHDLLVSAYSR